VEVDFVVILTAIDVVNNLQELLEHLLLLLIVSHSFLCHLPIHLHHLMRLILLIQCLQLPDSVADEGKREEGIV